MTATDPPDDLSATSDGAPGATAHGIHATPTEAAADTTAREGQEDEQIVLRIVHLPRDVGWMMVSVGVLGVILPGFPGTPFLLAGIAVLAPGGPRLLTRWAGRKPKGIVHSGLKQIGRWLDDLDRRYPRYPRPRHDVAEVAAAAPLRSVMNSQRLASVPKLQSQQLGGSKTGSPRSGP